MVAAAVSSTSAAAASPSLAEGLLALQRLDTRVATIGYRLAAANRDLCALQEALPGLVVHDLAQYAPDARAAAASQFGLDERPAISVVVAGGAAERAGLAAGDKILAIGGTPMPPRAPARKASFAGVEAVENALDLQLRSGSALIGYERAGQVAEARLDSELGCVSRVQVVPSGRLNAAADGEYAQLTSAVVEFAANDDELAIVIAHEMAHNILEHRKTLRSQKVATGILRNFGKNARRVRATEVEADYLAYYLAARAGYDIATAADLWKRLDGRTGAALIGSPTHLAGGKRVGLARAAAAEIAAKRAAGQPVVPEAEPPLPR